MSDKSETRDRDCLPLLQHAVVVGELPHKGCDVCDARSEADYLRAALEDIQAYDGPAPIATMRQIAAAGLSREAING